MIRCTTDHKAAFIDPSTGSRSRVSIIAWDEHGKPLIARQTGLVRADLIEGFERITDHVEPHTSTVTLRGEGAAL